LTARQAWPDPPSALRDLFGAAQCVLAASGTDAEYTCALSMGPQPFVSVLMDPAEIGGGCARAAAGLPHAQGGPVTGALPVRAFIETTRWRDAEGRALPPSAIDAQVFEIAGRHPYSALLLHHVPCSKTGLSAPSETACLDLQRRHAAGVRVVVDASQGRFHRDDVRRWLGWGWAVIVTGSKFFGAPPFCGATLLPAGWPPGQGFSAGPGLLARWRLALEAMSKAWATPTLPAAWSDALHESFLPLLGPVRIDGVGESDRHGILSLDLGLDVNQTLRLHRVLIRRGLFIGQPVAAGPCHLLRVARGVGTRMTAVNDELERLAHALRWTLRHG